MSNRTIVNLNGKAPRTNESGLRADVACARSFRRSLFVECDALAFGKLIEAALHAAAMEEPLLPSIVTDEAKAAVANESFDGAVWHCPLLAVADRREAEKTPASMLYNISKFRHGRVFMNS